METKEYCDTCDRVTKVTLSNIYEQQLEDSNGNIVKRKYYDAQCQICGTWFGVIDKNQ